jgi:plastocyanin
MRITTRWAAVTLMAALLGACGGDSPAEGNPAPVDSVAPNGESVAVQALDNTFRPETLEIRAGTEVVFTNVGRNDHNVLPASVAPGEMGEWGVATEDFAPRAVYRHVFGRPGSYAYYCSVHGTAEIGMIGTIVVTD